VINFFLNSISQLFRFLDFLDRPIVWKMSSLRNERVVEYVPADISEPPMVQQLRERRGGRLLNLDRMLLHSPNLALAWNTMFGTLRGSAIDVSQKLKELAICGIAVLNKAEYEFYQHEGPWVAAGATPAQVLAIRLINTDSFDRSCFDSLELAVVQLTIEMTTKIETSKQLMRELKTILGDKQLVELVGVISGYNMVSRFLVALDITADGEKDN
jgi:alkylhydroperoxidase family enzyme